MDTIMTEDWSDVKSEYHATVDSHDKEGRPRKELIFMKLFCTIFEVHKYLFF